MKKLVVFAVALAALSAAAQAGELLYTVALPATNDVSLSGAYQVANPGDQFTVSSSAVASAFSVWFVGPATGANATGNVGGETAANAASDFAVTGLYVGPDSGDTLTSVGGTLTYAPATYGNGTNYFNSGSGTYSNIWEATWSGLSLALDAGTLYDFAIATTSGDAYILTSTCAPAPDGCVDGVFLGYGDPTDNTTASFFNGIGPSNADVNVEIDTPEPGTWLLICAGVGVLGLSRRRRG